MNAMSDVIQPAGAFLRQAKLLQARRLSDPIAVVGSCSHIDEALRLRPDLDDEVDRDDLNLECQKETNQTEFEPESFLAAMRRGLEEVEDEEDDSDSDSDSDDDSGDEGCYYQASKENTYYSPDQKLPGGFMLDMEDALDLSDTSTASSSLLTTAWPHHEGALEGEKETEHEDLIFQLEM